MKLELGHNHPFEVRKEILSIGLKSSLTILFLSDLHLSRFNYKIVNELIQLTSNKCPDIVLLGGDYVDSKQGLIHFAKLIRGISYHPNIYAVGGNHDAFFGIKKIKDLIFKNNIHWLEDNGEVINIKGNEIYITNGSEWSKTVDLNVSLNHKPTPVNNNCPKPIVAFAGHLHGCQIVLKETKKGLYPGRYIYKWNFLKRKQDNVLYLTSKGLGDTIPIRYNCKKDVVFLTIN